MHQLTKPMNKEDMNGNDLQTIITHGLNQIKEKMGQNFDFRKVNLAEMQRITGVSQAKLWRLKKNNFCIWEKQRGEIQNVEPEYKFFRGE